MLNDKNDLSFLIEGLLSTLRQTMMEKDQGEIYINWKGSSIHMKVTQKIDIREAIGVK